MAVNPRNGKRDFKLDACVAYANEEFETPNVRTANLEVIVKVFRKNVSRVRFLMVMPPIIGHAGLSLQRVADLAELKVTGTLGNSLTEEQQTEISALLETLWQEDLARDMELRGTPEWDTKVKESHHLGSAPVNMLSRAPDGTLGFDMFLASYVVGAWTAIETLAGDLWEAALNIDPDGLALLKGKPRRHANASSPGTSRPRQKDEVSKSVDLDLIKFHGFDLRTKMGTVLRGRYEFSRLSKIRDAYFAAFDRESGQIEAAIMHESWDALSALRNLIVHKASVIDDEYLRRAKDLKIPQGLKGHDIILDGEIAVGIIKPAFGSAVRLITGVDHWLDKHKQKS
jgi:hypothetical protein